MSADEHTKPLSVEDKRALLRRRLAERQRPAASSADSSPASSAAVEDYRTLSFDMAMHSTSVEHDESRRFGQWMQAIKDDGAYSFEAARQGAQHTTVEIERADGRRLEVLNFGSYNYLGYAHHPEVIEVAKQALDRYGLGAASSPILSGTLELHRQLEQRLLDFFGLPDRGVSLFSSGYGVNTGTISAYVKQGHAVVLDRNAHMSIQEGAMLSKARIYYFRHNDPDNLDKVLERIGREPTRVLVCVEGVYSADGDFGSLARIVEVTKRHGAKILVDEAHSILVAGAGGRGVAEHDGVLDQIDLLVLTFSKAFGGVGGAVVARSEVARYINWYARCRMFSCAIDPAVTAGVTRSLELAGGSDGALRRKRLHDNAQRLRDELSPRVDIGSSSSWVVPVMYGADELTFTLNDELQKAGLDTSIMSFPAVPKGEARIRMFVTSEHSPAELRRAAEIITESAVRHGFAKEASP